MHKRAISRHGPAIVGDGLGRSSATVARDVETMPPATAEPGELVVRIGWRFPE
ncbi:MAG: hypothetical protein L0G59_02195 [Kocuria sp.]|nr:hypothetical protein [Kocuria sp.]